EIGSQYRQTIVVTLGPAVFNKHIVTFDITSFIQAAVERGNHRCISFGRSAIDEPNHWHRRLLRPRRERPNGGSASNERDELTSPHIRSQDQGTIVSAQTTTLIGAETGINTIAAVHSQCPSRVKTGGVIR